MKTHKLFTALVFSIILMSGKTVFAQISKGGTPPSFSTPSLQDSVAVIQMPVVNVDSLIQNDTVSDFSFRFGYAIDVNMNLNNSGIWDTLQNGDKFWRLKINSPSAFSINLIYDDFWLPDGAQFFVYNEDKSMILGAFIAALSNNPYNEFATDLVKGDITILEYYEPFYASGGKINVDKVIHAYKNTFSGHGGSGSCNNDITCSQGNDWCVEKRAASMILVDNNTRWCSGCLINSVRQDLTPYYLTANHCLRGDENTWIFRFKYWSPTCNQGDDAGHWVSITGSTIRANWDGSDFALLQLSAQPPSGFGVLFAGWDRTSTPSSSGVGIHHPSGDVMKISTYNTTPQAYLARTCCTCPFYIQTWRLQFNQGVVEPGSSGSPLFNQNNLLVGQLLGTTCESWLTCSNPSGDAVYGRFDISWNGGGTSATRLRDWLDPDNTGATSVGPTSPTIYLINRTLTGTHKFAALEEIHIEGNVTTSGPICQPSNVPFTTEPGSNVEIKARIIVCKPGTHFKAGSTVHIKAVNDIECSDNIVEGDYVNVFCNAQISMKMGGQNNNASASIDNNSKPEKEIVQDKLNFSESIILYPNPSSGKFEIEFLDGNLKSSEIIIYDATGKIVYEQNKITQNKIPLDFCNFQKGIYLVQIIHTGNSYTKKIILN